MKIPEVIETPNDLSPLKIRGLVLYRDYFTYKGKQYSYTDIRHLAFDWKTFKDLTPGSIWDLTMWFEIVGVSKRIKVKTLDNMFFNISMKRFKVFYFGYSYLAIKSFDARYNYYLNLYEEEGFFHYSGYYFYSDRITDRKGYELLIESSMIEVQKHIHGFILLAKEDVKPNFAQKLLPYNPRMVGALVEDADRDVIEQLLKDIYTLKIIN
ncbi:MAG: hypothetical protein HQ528_10155 [Candidatus Marinimicrobia bacterium]|nr:hypothetical protein [Candidatus Neomarinimicrobiota bacterium]